MQTTFLIRKSFMLGALAGSVLLAQDAPQPAPAQDAPPVAAPAQTAPQSQTQNGDWRRLGGPDNVAFGPQQNGAQVANPQGQAPQGYPPNYQPNYPPQGYQPPPLPAQLTIQPGTFITVRLNQVLSSDHSQQGDAFTASLVKPIVVDGIVVADRGQTIVGRVSDAEKAGRVKGTSKLGVELTDLNLIDGTPMPVHTALVSRSGPTSVGRDATAVGTTTGVGALAGAVADGGRGAGIGAGAGAAAGLVGVLLTRGQPTILYPEMVLTFRIENPVTVSTTRAPQAFRYVGPGDYDQPQDRPRMATRPGPAPYYGGAYAPYPYPYYGYPYYYGPGIGIRFGGGYYGHRYWR